MRALPSLTARKQLTGVVQSVQEGLGSDLAQVSAINVCLGVAVGVAMWSLGMPSPVLWSRQPPRRWSKRRPEPCHWDHFRPWMRFLDGFTRRCARF